MNTKIDHNSAINQQVKGKLVEREVYTCFSYEMDAVLKAQGEDLPSWEDIENLDSTICPHCGEEVSWELDCEDEEKCPYCDEEISDEYELDREAQEIFEWWIVSSWLYERLKERGCPVLEWGNNYYWGRTTTGQAILLDGVIGNIAREMEILEGQENHKYWV